MRVLVLCAAAFAGGILAGAVFWPSSASSPRRAADAPRESLAPDRGSGRLPGDPGWTATGPGGGATPAAAVTHGSTSLRDLAADAAEHLESTLEKPAARAFLDGDGTITGFVRGPAGEPVRDVAVTATPEAQPFDLAAAARRARERAHEDVDLGTVARAAIESELWRREVRRTARTDSEGRYEIKELVEGWHRVTAYHDDYDVQPDPRNNRVQPDAVLDFRAQPVTNVRVEVRLPDGELADHAWVSWQGAQGNGGDAWMPEPGTVRLPRAACRVRAQVWFPEPLQSAETEYDAGIAGAPLVLKVEGRRMLSARLVPAEGLSVPDRVEFRLRRLEGSADVDPASLKDDQARGASPSQGRATWYDLEPGRYLVAAFLGGSHLLAHAVAEMGDVSVDVGLPFESPPAGTFVTAKLLAPDGAPTQGTTRFTIVTGPAERARHHQADALRRADGAWLVLLPDEPGEGEATLRASVSGYGTAQERFEPQRPGTATIRFGEPARMKLVVERFAGSGVEGRLFAALWGEEGMVSMRQVEADGRCDLGDVQPKDYSLVLYVRDRDTRWSIATRRVALRSGEQEESATVPALHTLVVRPSPGLRAREVTIQSSDPSVGWVRRTARVEGEVATFDALAAVQYEVRCGNKRVEVRLPAAGEVAIE
jgi:hypothetical protein